MTAEALAVWCAEVAAGFRGHEHHTQTVLRFQCQAALAATHNQNRRSS